MKKILLILLSLFVFAWCMNQDNNVVNNNQDLNSKSWKGNKFVWFFSTTCPHCQDKMPELEKFYNEHNGEVNMEVNVLNKKQFTSVENIPQNYKNPKGYTDYTGESCWYVPSYVIIDENENIIDKKCWWSPSTEQLEQYLLSWNNQGNDEEQTSNENHEENETLNEQNLDNNNEKEMTKEVRLGDTVEVNYVWTFTDGKVFDTSLEEKAKEAGIHNSARDYKPLKFTTGQWQMIPCFDKGVVGMKVWESKEITCQPEEAYGKCDDEKVQTVKKEQLKQFEDNGYKIEKWAELPTQYGMIKVQDIQGEDVTLDMNNPMCGKVLNFNVTIVDVQE